MKLKTQLLLAPLVTGVVALAAGGLYGTLIQRDSAASQASFSADVDRYKTVGDAHEQLGQAHAGAYRALATVDTLDEAKIAALQRDLTQQLQGVRRVVAAIAEDSGSDAALAAAVAESAGLLDQYIAGLAGALGQAKADPKVALAKMAEDDVIYSKLAAAMRKVLARTGELHDENVAASTAHAQRLAALLGGLGLLAVGVAMTAAWRGQRRLAADLARALHVSDQVAAGNLTVQAHSDRQDEIGDLQRAQGHMAERLRHSLQTVRQASDSIATASLEIASGNADLSHRTEQTASNLQQAASSMSELTGTVSQTAQSASTAIQLAASASDVASRGGAVVSQVVSTMDEINTSSKRIGDIIGVIDGIAFQTNILALNAAVEAARAGEQGRGFAVVAAEVRSLAQRSAEAAREIKSLIGASVDKVESGARLVQDAGTTMTEIVASVQRVSDIIGEISAATGEQSQGIGQVNGTVTQLDQATQQNAALVEESAAAAESLKEQARQLADVVAAFKLGTEPGPARHAVPAREVAQKVISQARSPTKPAAAAPAARRTTPPSTPSTPPAAAADGAWESF